jgi:hypothetical protein
VILHGLGMFVADMFKSRHRLEAESLFLRSFSKGQVGLNGEISQAIRAGLASHHLVFFGLKASPKDMRQSVAKLPWIFRVISFQDPCLVEEQMCDVLLE